MIQLSNKSLYSTIYIYSFNGIRIWLLFVTDLFQFFSWGAYQIPLLIILYCARCITISPSTHLYILFLIGTASVYTHGIFGAQLLPVGIMGICAYSMHYFIYKKSFIPYLNIVIFVLSDWCMQTYIWHMSLYIHYTYVTLLGIFLLIWLFGKNNYSSVVL